MDRVHTPGGSGGRGVGLPDAAREEGKASGERLSGVGSNGSAARRKRDDRRQRGVAPVQAWWIAGKLCRAEAAVA